MNGGLISSALPVFEVLHLIANSNEPLSTADLSRLMNLPSSTVHRFLSTLEQEGYITRYMRSARFIPGHTPQHLCRALFNRFPLSRLGPPIMQQIAQSSHATVTLMARIGWFGLRIEVTGDATPIGKIAGPEPLAPLHATLEGRAILAFLSETEVEGYQRYHRRHASEMPGARAKLWPELRESQKTGFVLSPPVGLGRDRAALALPVRGPVGEPVAALGIIGAVVEADLRQATPAVKGWIDMRDALEGDLARDAGNMLSPFAHLDPDTILAQAARSG